MDFKIFLTLLVTCSLSRTERQKRTLIFPPTSLYGTFLAVAVPVDIPDKNVFVSYNFEANYSTLNNITEIDEAIFPNLPIVGGRHARSITRELAYTVLEKRFEEHGMKGRECLLRNICEAAETPLHDNGVVGHVLHIIFTHGMKGRECLLRNICEAAETPLHDNGVVGHVMHIIFTPSTSQEEGIDEAYYEAEAAGRRGSCDAYFHLCPYSLFDIITRIVHFAHKE